MNSWKKWIGIMALCLILLLPATFAQAALGDITTSVDMWVHTSSLTVNMDTVVTHERPLPYRVLYFMAGGTVYDSSGSFNTFETRMSDSFAGYVVDGAYYYEALGNGKGVLHQGWDGGYTESNFDRWMNASVGNGTDFGMELSASADSFVTGEEIFLKGDVVSLSGSHPPYEPYFHIFTAPNTSDIKPSLDSGLPDTLIFKEPGTYYVFGTVVDGRKGRSMLDGMTITIAQGPETTAKITDFDRVHTHIAEGDMLDWTLKADPGAGDLQQIVYLYKDGEFLSRHVIDGLEGAIPIQERGTYSMRIRLKDLANNAYSPFYSTGNMTVHPLYSYNVLNEGKENESIELTYYNSYNPAVALPDTFDGYPVTAVKDYLLNYIDDTITSLTWTPAVPTVPGSIANGCPLLETVILPDGVKAIGNGAANYGAFSGCTSLKNVTLPDSLTAIGTYAFQSCSALESFTIGKNVESLGNAAFSGCTALKEIIFGEKLKDIGHYAFQNSGLETLVLPKGVTMIGTYAFNQAPIRRLELPDSVTSVDGRTFEGIESTLTYLRWPGGVETVPGGTFYKYTKLETVVLGEGVTAIGNAVYTSPSIGAFDSCTSLKNVTLPDTLVSIGHEAFQSCTALETFTIGKNVESLGNHVFDNCTALKEITFGEKLKTIGDDAFYKCTLLTSLVLPEGVTSIGGYAFSYSGVSHLELPDSVTTLDERTFYNLSETLTYLRWPGGVATVPGGTFYNCTKLETVVLGEGVTAIADAKSGSPTIGAFDNCTSLKNVTLPDTLTSIGSQAFQSCIALETFTIGKNVEALGDYVFDNCTALKEIIFGEKLQTIGSSAFYNCKLLTSMVVPNGLTTIGRDAFAHSGISRLELPDSVTTVDENTFDYLTTTLTYLRWPGGVATVPGGTFYNFDLLETVILPEGVTEIAYSSYGAFQSCDALTTIVLPDSLKTVGRNAFLGCAKLSSVTLGKGTEIIASGAFQSTGITSILLPEGLTTVEGSAFANSKLESLSFPDSVTTLEKSAYDGLRPTLKHLRWPAGIPVVPGNMFYSFDALETVILPEGVTELAYDYYGAFHDCDALTAIVLPDSLKTVGRSAFCSCDALESVTLGRNTEAIGQHAFSDCKMLSTITFSDSLKTIGNGAFSGTGLTTLTLPDGLTTVGGNAFTNGKLESISFPDSVTTLDKTALDYNETTLKYVRWPGGVPVVPGGTFNNFDALETVILPEGVTELAYDYYGAFQDCDTLTSLVLPASLKTIGQKAFYSCDALESITLGQNTETIGQQAFQACSQLNTIVFGKSLKTIGYGSFGSSGLTVLTLPDGLTTVESSAFANSKLESISFPDSVTALDKSALDGNRATLKHVRWPGGVPVVPGNMFYNCDVLETVILPEGVTEIAYSSYGAFQSCDALVYVSLPSTLKTLGTKAFYSCKLEQVWLPCNITSAAKRCFDSGVVLYCAPSSPTAASLEEAGLAASTPASVLTLPAAIQAVEAEAFRNSGAELVIVPEGCLSIGEKAFGGMENLRYVVLPESLVTIAQNAFEGTQLLGVVAPEGSAAQQELTDAQLPFAPMQQDET